MKQNYHDQWVCRVVDTSSCKFAAPLQCVAKTSRLPARWSSCWTSPVMTRGQARARRLHGCCCAPPSRRHPRILALEAPRAVHAHRRRRPSLRPRSATGSTPTQQSAPVRPQAPVHPRRPKPRGLSSTRSEGDVSLRCLHHRCPALVPPPVLPRRPAQARVQHDQAATDGRA